MKRKKLLLTMLIAFTVAIGAAAFSACSLFSSPSASCDSLGHNLRHVEAVEANCDGGNVEYWYCRSCGQYFLDEAATERVYKKDVALPASHQLESVAEEHVSCDTAGHSAYLHCGVCDQYFLDASCTYAVTLEEIATPASHTLDKHFEEVAPTCTTEGRAEYWQCSECDRFFLDEYGRDEVTESALVLPVTHELVFCEGTNATCLKEGVKSHYKCEICDKMFADEAYQTEYSAEDVVEPVINHHLEQVAGVQAQCTVTGLTEHYRCDMCGTRFADENAQTVLNDVIIPATGEHDYVDGVCSMCHKTEEAASVVIDRDYIFAHGNTDYGYRWLATQPNGENLQSCYRAFDAVAQEVIAGKDVTDMTSNGIYYAAKIYSKDYGLTTKDELQTAYKIYFYDHPLYYWFHGNTFLSASATSGGKTYYLCYMVVREEYNLKAERDALESVMIDNIIEMYHAADNVYTDYEIALAYHDAITLAADYTYGEDGNPSNAVWAHSIVGFFDDDPATGPVCESYSRAFQLMLNLKGVNNVYCVGYASSAGTGGGGGHAWSLVQLEDGGWYWYDLTWDDGNNSTATSAGTTGYSWCAVSANELPNGLTFETTHRAGDYVTVFYDLPEISQTPYAGMDFKPGSSYEDDDFIYLRTGMATVAITSVKVSASSLIVIPEKVTIYGTEYTVTQIGPHYNANGSLTGIVAAGTVNIVLPKSVTRLYNAAFYAKITNLVFWYDGTQSDWQNIATSAKTFYDATKVTVHCAGEWELVGDVPTLI